MQIIFSSHDVFLFAHCVSLLLHVHCLPTCSIMLFGLMTTRLNKYYYYYYYSHYYYYYYYYYIICANVQKAAAFGEPIPQTLCRSCCSWTTVGDFRYPSFPSCIKCQ